MNNQTKSENQLITNAINMHGIIFKKAVREVLEGLRSLKIIGEEYPIHYLEGGSLDLLALYLSDTQRYILPIECKRGYVATKKWVFFADPDGNCKLQYLYDDKTIRVGDAGVFSRMGVPICIEGVEIEMSKAEKGGAYKASPDAIWKAAFQACKGSLGFLIQEMGQRNKAATSLENFITFPLLITTAPLFVSKMNT
jgi:hypothetical protein